jgi:ribosomal protein S20
MKKSLSAEEQKKSLKIQQNRKRRNLRREEERNMRNRQYKNMVKNSIKKALQSGLEEDRKNAESLLMSRMVKKVIGKNKAIRKVSRLTKKMRMI